MPEKGIDKDRERDMGAVRARGGEGALAAALHNVKSKPLSISSFFYFVDLRRPQVEDCATCDGWNCRKSALGRLAAAASGKNKKIPEILS